MTIRDTITLGSLSREQATDVLWLIKQGLEHYHQERRNLEATGMTHIRKRSIIERRLRIGEDVEQELQNFCIDDEFGSGK